MSKRATNDDVRIIVRIFGAVEFCPQFEFASLPGKPRQHARFDAGKVANKVAMAGRGADHRAGDVADCFDRRLQSSTVVEDGGDFCVYTLAIALKILWLRPAAGPATGRSAVEPEGAAHAVVGTAPIPQSLNLGGRGVGELQAQLDGAAY